MGNILYHHTKASKADWYSKFPCQVKPAKDMRMKVEYQSRPYESIQISTCGLGVPKISEACFIIFMCAQQSWTMTFAILHEIALFGWNLPFSWSWARLGLHTDISVQCGKNMENKVHNQALQASKRAMSRNGRVDPVQPWICWLTARFLRA